MRIPSFRIAAAAVSVFVFGGAAVLRADDYDWRSKGAVTPVKNEGAPTFDASWAFAVTGAAEGYWQISGHALISLSEQELIDCVPAVGDCGDPSCGQAPCGLNFVLQNGLCRGSDYPYTAREGACKECTPAVTIPGWTRLDGEAGIAAAIVNGPVIARLKIGDHGAPSAAYTNYVGGVSPGASTDDSVHQWVLIVGLITSSSQPYWIIKNSIGSSWGLSGFMELGQNKNSFGIGDDAYAISDDTAHGACALPDGSCQDMAPADCSIAGGIYGGDLSFCPASCASCPGDVTAPVIVGTATPRPTKKNAGTLTLTVAGTASDDCALDPSSAEYSVTDSYSPGAPIQSGPVTIGGDGSFSFPVTVAATRIGKRSHVYKIIVSVRDLAGNTGTITIAVPIT